MLIEACSSFPTFASQRGDSTAKIDIIKMIPAKMMCKMVASIHWSALLFEM